MKYVVLRQKLNRAKILSIVSGVLLLKVLSASKHVLATSIASGTGMEVNRGE